MSGKYVTVRANNITKTLVCIDRTASYEMEGRLINPYQKTPAAFLGTIHMVMLIEKMLDRFSFPESSVKYRSFRKSLDISAKYKSPWEVKRWMSDEIFDAEKGTKATFVVQVQFRQNATWQGTIQWLDERKTQKFRSTLEMIKLMDEALSKQSEDQDTSCWENLNCGLDDCKGE